MLVLAAGLLAANPARADCKVGEILELPITWSGGKPLTPVRINNQAFNFLADSGASYSSIVPATAELLHLVRKITPTNLIVRGVGGSSRPEMTIVGAFGLAGVTLRSRSLLLLPSGGGSASGVVGQDILGAYDVEYDLGRGAIRLMKPVECSGAALAYWAGQRPVAEVRIDAPEGAHVMQTVGEAHLNGVRIKVMFDSGAQVSVLDVHAAVRAGVKLDGSDAKPAGLIYGSGQKPMKAWMVKFASFKMGDEEIRSPEIRVTELGQDVDMLLGDDFFLSHRVYVANSQHRLYLTYEGGSVFGVPTLSMTRNASGQLVKTDASETAASAPTDPEPTDADSFSRRGAADVAKHDLARAIADFSRAIELAPAEPKYLFERASARQANHQPALAMADLDQVMKLAPGALPALIMRAQLRLSERDQAGAASDIDTASKLAPKQADQRLIFGDIYRAAARFDSAVTEYDSWIAAHEGDSRLANALFGRCRARAILGRDLDEALADCNRALGLSPKAAGVLETRGIVRFKSGAYDDAIRDFDAALSVMPKEALSLYVRGQAKVKKGQGAEGDADMKAAVALQANIGVQAKNFGLAPTS